MADSVNKAIVIGRLGNDPEMRQTSSGTPVANFSVATNRRWKSADGTPQEETEWHRIVAFSRLAEICGQYLKKGRLVYIEGRLQTRSWDDKQTGQKKYMTEIVALEMQMLGSRGEGGYADTGQRGATSESGPTSESGSAAPEASVNSFPEADDLDDDLPF